MRMDYKEFFLKDKFRNRVSLLQVKNEYWSKFIPFVKDLETTLKNADLFGYY